MARHVFDARMIAHIWANKGQDSARTSSHNLYFTGATLFSYGSHFAIAHHLENGRVLWNESGYSNTSAKQKGYAWQALSGAQRETHISAPGLTDQCIRNLERVRREGHKKGHVLPDLILACASEVRRAIARMSTLKRAPKQIADCWGTAKQYEKSGLALCAYIQETSKARIVWPVAALPEQCPESAEARAELARIVARSEILSAYAKHCERFAEYCNAIRGMLDPKPEDMYRSQADKLRDFCNNASLELHGAAVNYKNANKRAMPGLKKKGAELAELEKLASARVSAVYMESGKREIARAMRTIAKFERRDAIAERNKWAAVNVDALRTECARLEGFKVSGFEAFRDRVTRMAAWRYAERYSERMRAEIVGMDSWLDGGQANGIGRKREHGLRLYRRCCGCRKARSFVWRHSHAGSAGRMASAAHARDCKGARPYRLLARRVETKGARARAASYRGLDQWCF